MKRSELKYLVESFENADLDIKLTLWYKLIRAWLCEIEQKKYEKGYWDFDKDCILQYRDKQTVKELEKWK